MYKSIPISTDNPPLLILDMLQNHRVGDVMNRRFITAKKTDNLRRVQQLLKENSITGMPIMDGKRIIGLISVDNIIKALDKGVMDEKAEDHMTRSVVMLEDDMPLMFAIAYFEKYQYRRFPVLNKDKELCGILTSRDILIFLLGRINQEILRMEEEQTAARIKDETVEGPNAESSKSKIEFLLRRYDFENAGKASTAIKRKLKELAYPAKMVRRVAVASYELEMNIINHSQGGKLQCDIIEDQIIILAEDSGPGISNVEEAMREGYSTANEWIRSLGFGAGMGLPNTKRVADDFDIQSAPGKGTKVSCIFYKED